MVCGMRCYGGLLCLVWLVRFGMIFGELLTARFASSHLFAQLRRFPRTSSMEISGVVNLPGAQRQSEATCCGTRGNT